MCCSIIIYRWCDWYACVYTGEDMAMKQLAIKLNSLGYMCVGADIVKVDNVENANINLDTTPLGQYVKSLESKRLTKKRIKREGITVYEVN